MVWALSYRPKPDSYPSADILEGSTGELELVDPTADGGTGLAMSRDFSGRRAKPESVPKVIRWNGRRKLLDYETVWIATVSDRFCALIEEIEPGIHQFEPVRFVGKDGSDLGTRWFWQICNRIDSVHRDRSNLELVNGAVWISVPGIKSVLAFSFMNIGRCQFWHDKHMSNSTFVSDEAKVLIEAAGITGLHFQHFEQA